MSRIQYLGSHKEQPIADVGVCLRGNPVPQQSKRFPDLLREYPYIYKVEVKNSAMGKFFQILAKVER